MNLTLKIFQACRNFRRYQCSAAISCPIVKVQCIDDEENIKVSFKYLRSPYLNVKAPKDENIQNVLSRIKLLVNLQRKKEELRQVVMNRLSNTVHVALEQAEEDIVVNLMQNNSFMGENISNIEAWTQATQLKIGDVVYDIKYNLPHVISLTLPKYVLSDCFIRPTFRLECACLEDSVFKWYRSLPKDKISKIMNTESNDILIEEDQYWLKVGEGFIYKTCSDDVGCLLKVVCTPKSGDNTGFDYSDVMVSPVEKIPDRIPFAERQKHTLSLTDNKSIRCLSYNTLANTYVDRKKFPYCSEKASDKSYRKQLLMKELIGYNSDILCLQEIEERFFTYDMLPLLKEYGFDGYYKKKGGRRYEGLATFFRSNKFMLVDKTSFLLNGIITDDVCKDLRLKIGKSHKDISTLLKQDSALQILLLQHTSYSNCKVIVANTHLYSNKDSPEVRLIQAAVCTYCIEHFKKTKNVPSAAVLFCGDFNSLPSSDTYNFITNGKYSPISEDNASSNIDETLVHDLDLSSACGTPDYTNYTEEFNGCLDYIFYSKKHLKVTEIVPMPKHEDVIAFTGLPNEYFPSDHIALICTLKFNIL